MNRRAGSDLDVGFDRGAGVNFDIGGQPGLRIDRGGRADAGAALRARRTKMSDNGGERLMHVVDDDGRLRQRMPGKICRHDQGAGGRVRGALDLERVVDQRDVARAGVVQRGGAGDGDGAVAHQLAAD